MMNKDEVKKMWQRFAEGKDFMLNPDSEKVDMVADGVLSNEKSFGLRFCPCRLRTGDKQKDLLIVCPCNFKTQKNWEELGECRCELFVRRKDE
jgi:ferredoxin-thioredoxin reductase catalytic chain